MRCFSILLCILIPLVSQAQWRPDFDLEKDSIPMWDYHCSVGTAVAVGNGVVTSYLSVAPSIEYHPNNRLSLRAGFSALNSMDPSRFIIRGNGPQSMAPRKNSSLAIAAYIAADYRLNDRLMMSVMFFREAGQVLLSGRPSWLGWIPNGTPFNIDLTGFAADFRYRLSDDDYIGVHISIFRNRGDFPYFFPYDGYYGYGMWNPYAINGVSYNPFSLWHY